MPTYDSREMSRRGKIGSAVQQSRHHPKDMTKAARAGTKKKYLDQVDPERKLPEAERERRAKARERAAMLRLNDKRWGR